jgi:hypothetical protein
LIFARAALFLPKKARNCMIAASGNSGARNIIRCNQNLNETAVYFMRFE